MAYWDYNYDDADSFEAIAEEYEIPLTELYKVNNILPPYKEKPSDIAFLDGTIKIPVVLTGNESVENRIRENTVQQSPPQRRPKYSGITGLEQKPLRYQCYITIRGIDWHFPCWPENYSDSRQAHFTNQHPLGRSEPFQIYQNSGPRTVSVSFTMHREMEYYPGQPIDYIVSALQSAVYPTGFEKIVPDVTLHLGANCYIKGIIEGTVNAEWSGPINKNKQYNVVNLSFTVTECTGEPKVSNQILNARGV